MKRNIHDAERPGSKHERKIILSPHRFTIMKILFTNKVQ